MKLQSLFVGGSLGTYQAVLRDYLWLCVQEWPLAVTILGARI